MSWITRVLHLDEPTVTEDDRRELAQLQVVTQQSAVRAAAQANEASRIARYLMEQSKHNHIAERLNAAIQRGR
jgi:hypothetical protein